MSTVFKISGYETSRDYRKLADLMQRQSVVCISDYGRDCRDVAHTIWSPTRHGGVRQICARGVTYVYATTVEEFVAGCEKANVEVLTPQVEVGIVACPYDSNGDGDCGRPACPMCGVEARAAVQRQVRRDLIMRFFAIGTIPRWEVCEKGGWLTEADQTATVDQKLWADIFGRIEQRGEFEKLRKLLDEAK